MTKHNHDEQAQSELDAVMMSVDKWLPDDYPLETTNPTTRACDAREIGLRAIEQAQAERERLRFSRQQIIEAAALDNLDLKAQLAALREERERVVGALRTIYDLTGSPKEMIEAAKLLAYQAIPAPPRQLPNQRPHLPPSRRLKNEP